MTSISKPTVTNTEQPADTRDMVVLHTALRREFRLASGLVCGVPAGALDRAATVAEHLKLISWLLHHHHETENRILWPMLQQRVADELAPTITLMQTQHHGIDEAVTASNRLVARWKDTADVGERDELASTLARLNGVLVEHLDAEEQRILPLAAGCMTAAEWGRLGREGMAGTQKSKRPLLFGMYAYEGSPEGLALMMSRAPRLARLLIPRIAPRVYARYARRVYGTSTPGA